MNQDEYLEKYDKACLIIDKNHEHKFKFSKAHHKKNAQMQIYLPEYSVIHENISENNLLNSFGSRV